MSMKRKNTGHRSPATEDFDVPFFTVAHYKSPTATPTTYEFAAPQAYSSQPQPIPRPQSQTNASKVSPVTPIGTPPSYSHSFSPTGYNNPGQHPLGSSSSSPHYTPQFGSPRGSPFSPQGSHRVPHPGIPPSIPENHHDTGSEVIRPFTADLQREQPGIQQFSGEGAGEALCSDSLEPNISPVSLAFGPSLPGESWWPPDDIISPSDASPVNQYQMPPSSTSGSRTYDDNRKSRNKERTPVDTIPEVPLQEQALATPSVINKVAIKQPVNFTISPPTRPKRKRTPDSCPQRAKSSTSNGGVGGSGPRVARAAKVYEDATVSDAGEQLFPSDDSKDVEEQEQVKSGHESSESLTDFSGRCTAW